MSKRSHSSPAFAWRNHTRSPTREPRGARAQQRRLDLAGALRAVEPQPRRVHRPRQAIAARRARRRRSRRRARSPPPRSACARRAARRTPPGAGARRGTRRTASGRSRPEPAATSVTDGIRGRAGHGARAAAVDEAQRRDGPHRGDDRGAPARPAPAPRRPAWRAPPRRRAAGPGGRSPDPGDLRLVGHQAVDDEAARERRPRQRGRRRGRAHRRAAGADRGPRPPSGRQPASTSRHTRPPGGAASRWASQSAISVIGRPAAAASARRVRGRIADHDVLDPVLVEPQRLGQREREHAAEARRRGRAPTSAAAAHGLRGEAHRLPRRQPEQRRRVGVERVEVDDGERRLERARWRVQRGGVGKGSGVHRRTVVEWRAAGSDAPSSRAVRPPGSGGTKGPGTVRGRIAARWRRSATSFCASPTANPVGPRGRQEDRMSRRRTLVVALWVLSACLLLRARRGGRRRQAHVRLAGAARRAPRAATCASCRTSSPAGASSPTSTALYGPVTAGPRARLGAPHRPPDRRPHEPATTPSSSAAQVEAGEYRPDRRAAPARGRRARAAPAGRGRARCPTAPRWRPPAAPEVVVAMIAAGERDPRLRRTSTAAATAAGTTRATTAPAPCPTCCTARACSTTALDSSGFMSWGEPGPGAWVTHYANPGHSFMVIAGLRFDTSGRAEDNSRWDTDDAVVQRLHRPPPSRSLDALESGTAHEQPRSAPAHPLRCSGGAGVRSGVHHRACAVGCCRSWPSWPSAAAPAGTTRRRAWASRRRPSDRARSRCRRSGPRRSAPSRPCARPASARPRPTPGAPGRS